MPILWRYLKAYRWLAGLALTLAGVAQVLALLDPIIFGNLIDEYATNPGQKTEPEKVTGVLHLLALAVGVAILANVTKAFQEYLTRLVVQQFGTDIFNDGLRQMFRLSYLLSGVITESLRNIELVKSLGLTFPEIRRLTAQTKRIFELEMYKVRRVRLLSFWQSTTLNLLKQSVLFTLLWLIVQKVLSLGELISMQFISVAIFNPLQELGNIILAYCEAEARLNGFDQLMQKLIERNPESAVEVGPIQRLRFAGVVFRHQGASQNAIDGVSFEAGLSETIAFVGPSDSGKSTMVKLLVGLYHSARDHYLRSETGQNRRNW